MGKTPRPMSPLVRVLKSEGLCEGVSAAHPRQNRGMGIRSRLAGSSLAPAQDIVTTQCQETRSSARHGKDATLARPCATGWYVVHMDDGSHGLALTRSREPEPQPGHSSTMVAVAVWPLAVLVMVMDLPQSAPPLY
jgi:hypothetical protein